MQSQVFGSKGRFHALGSWNHQHKRFRTKSRALEAGTVISKQISSTWRGKKKKKKEACLCVLAQLGDRQATGRDAKEGTPSSLLAGSVHALVEGLWPSNSAERRALALLPACPPRASASAQLERTQRDAASLATSSDPTRQLSPRAAAECCNKQPINHSELHSVAFFFFSVYFFGRSNSFKKKSSRTVTLRGFSFWQRH